MTFHFPYEHILSLKEREKDLSLSEMGLLIIKKEGIEKELHSLAQKRHDCISQWEQVEGGTFISDILQQNEYLDFLDLKITRLEAELKAVEQDIAEQKEELLLKQKEEKTWHLLREKSLDSYMEQQKKIEQDSLDEIAAIRHYHQRLSL
ncbi:flagellar export protein FliJ [Neobacillus piezotolerans]|uniref:Flagellar FliJ protein n=1 Tax=Neobacillus piezotolerans TaxID=2259171 RepID=A0A3D8GNN1_9BACI|nr:flagellar export protein FliJ [Neobacillus piezotolerans]RDU35891.1 flagellar export protein FliJ [Neobacillus piezotolerans]